MAPQDPEDSCMDEEPGSQINYIPRPREGQKPRSTERDSPEYLDNLSEPGLT